MRGTKSHGKAACRRDVRVADQRLRGNPARSPGAAKEILPLAIMRVLESVGETLSGCCRCCGDATVAIEDLCGMDGRVFGQSGRLA